MNLKKTFTLLAAFLLLGLLALLFLGGIFWSLVPICGNTLPHHLAEWSGVAFSWSVLLVSSLIGVAGAGWMAAGAVIHALITESELDW